MALLFSNARGPALDLDLPASEPPADVVITNATTGKTMRLRIPEDWTGADVTLDFARQTITDMASGADLSSLLDPTNRGLWIANPMINGSNDVRIEATAPGLLVAKDEFNQAAGAITGKAPETGGLWEADGDADDYVTTGGGSLQRTAISDTLGLGRRIFPATPAALAACRVRMDLLFGAGQLSANKIEKIGVFGRRQAAGVKVRASANLFWNGPSNIWLWQLQFNQNESAAAAGTVASVAIGATERAALEAGKTFTIVLELVGNSYKGWFGEKGKLPGLASPTLSTTHNWLEGKEISVVNGKVGIEDETVNANAITRLYDKFRAYDLASKSPYVVNATMRWEKGYF